MTGYGDVPVGHKMDFVVSAVLVYKEFKVLGKRQVGN